MYAMPAEFMSAFAFLAGALVAMVGTCVSVSRGAQLQQEILKRGLPAHGRVLRIWRPPVFGAFTRVYFEFQPIDARRRSRPVTSTAASPMSSPRCPRSAARCAYVSAGNPSRAVIAKLVSRFEH